MECARLNKFRVFGIGEKNYQSWILMMATHVTDTPLEFLLNLKVKNVDSC